MLSKLQELQEIALKKLADAKNAAELNELKVQYLGKKGQLTQLARNIAEVDVAERPQFGQAVNKVKAAIEECFAKHWQQLEEEMLNLQLKKESIDITLPGRQADLGSLHPLTQIIDEIKGIFIGMGYTVEEGPQIESDYYNFEALNLPADHPAREMQDSFYITSSTLLRTHTSPVQVRTMEKLVPQVPVKIICPGSVYRRDDDATHSPMFHQVEGLVIDKNITMANLKGTLLTFARQMFGVDRQIRLRPSYFPFTEPSAEVDISCFVCGGKGCNLCKHTGWIEVLGSGMVHPRVLSMSGYDPEQVTGFAFGIGVERIAMLKYGIGDIRLFFENDLRFLSQF